MVGGLESALQLGAADIASFCDSDPAGKIAVDLGAGFGMHAIPLARQGYTVTAIDTSTELLSQLRAQSPHLGIRTVVADILTFPQYVDEPADLFLCMGDTLTHLQDQASVDDLVQNIARCLKPGGKLALTFRDYTKPPAGIARFIPVRSDQDRILTCFLEATPTHMDVHDVLYERRGVTWQMKVSSYMKLRLSAEWVAQSLKTHGLVVQIGAGRGGMVSIVAMKMENEQTCTASAVETCRRTISSGDGDASNAVTCLPSDTRELSRQIQAQISYRLSGRGWSIDPDAGGWFH
jgi:SAM-dependent methyltransferase